MMNLFRRGFMKVRMNLNSLGDGNLKKGWKLDFIENDPNAYYEYKKGKEKSDSNKGYVKIEVSAKFIIFVLINQYNKKLRV
jgi:hypothetical protein